MLTRAELLPDEPDHPRAGDSYYKIEIGPLQPLPRPVPSRALRRIAFIPTTLSRLLARARSTTCGSATIRRSGCGWRCARPGCWWSIATRSASRAATWPWTSPSSAATAASPCCATTPTTTEAGLRERRPADYELAAEGWTRAALQPAGVGGRAAPLRRRGHRHGATAGWARRISHGLHGLHGLCGFPVLVIEMVQSEGSSSAGPAGGQRPSGYDMKAPPGLRNPRSSGPQGLPLCSQMALASGGPGRRSAVALHHLIDQYRLYGFPVLVIEMVQSEGSSSAGPAGGQRPSGYDMKAPPGLRNPRSSGPQGLPLCSQMALASGGPGRRSAVALHHLIDQYRLYGFPVLVIEMVQSEGSSSAGPAGGQRPSGYDMKAPPGLRNPRSSGPQGLPLCSQMALASGGPGRRSTVALHHLIDQYRLCGFPVLVIEMVQSEGSSSAGPAGGQRPSGYDMKAPPGLRNPRSSGPQGLPLCSQMALASGGPGRRSAVALHHLIDQYRLCGFPLLVSEMVQSEGSSSAGPAGGQRPSGYDMQAPPGLRNPRSSGPQGLPLCSQMALASGGPGRRSAVALHHLIDQYRLYGFPL